VLLVSDRRRSFRLLSALALLRGGNPSMRTARGIRLDKRGEEDAVEKDDCGHAHIGETILPGCVGTCVVDPTCKPYTPEA